MVYVLVESATVKMDGKDLTARKVFDVYFPCALFYITKAESCVLVHIHKLDVDA